ncbi:uncharacterized protein N7506_006265 [Penicillium brevicompactum]|uniref:uncharacterized protein n=1 Tax=Penicillium brevicompactum TaxID=5074 RepID=UPI00253FA34C|nr:uncharacterized protein N7506_006265 [Penicillium brevicompactum]KAJ5332482.1 hypothetical protein N7506_006265 [Penicillium brevicompactum]
MAAFLLRNSTGSWKTVSVVRVANNGICLAIVIAMAIQAIEHSGLAVDYLLVYYLTIALFYSESYNLLDKGVTTPTTSRYSLVADVPLIVQNLLFAFMSFFGSWFWIAGIDRAEATPCSNTAACIWLFDIQALSWRIFAATLGTLTGIIFTVFLVVHALNLIPGNHQGPIVQRANAVVVKISRTKALSAVSLGRLRTELQYEWPAIQNDRWQSIVRPQNPLAHGFWRTNGLEMLHWISINLLGPVITIVSVERMISANAITTDGIADSSGQLIALMTGIFAICVAISETAAKYLGNSKRCQTEASDPAQYLLSRQAYCDSTPFSADQIAMATQGFVKLQNKRDPAFLDDLIGASQGALNSHLPQDYPLTVCNREIAYITADRQYRNSSNGQSYGIIANYEARDSIGWTPLLRTAFDGDISQIQHILDEVKGLHLTDQREILNAQDDYGRTPLWWAVAKAHADVVKLLIENDLTDINTKDIHFQRTPLALASLQGSATLVKMPLEACHVMVNTPN